MFVLITCLKANGFYRERRRVVITIVW